MSGTVRRGWKVIGGLAAAALAVCLLAPSAVAASPRQIYKDYADNGRLDRKYSAKDIQAALRDAAVEGYGSQTAVIGMAAAAQKQLRVSRPASAAAERAVAPAAVVPRSGTLPFTGLDLALLVAGGAAMLLVGGGLRKLGRGKA
jgi:hypothetical protein